MASAEDEENHEPETRDATNETATQTEEAPPVFKVVKTRIADIDRRLPETHD